MAIKFCTFFVHLKFSFWKTFVPVNGRHLSLLKWILIILFFMLGNIWGANKFFKVSACNLVSEFSIRIKKLSNTICGGNKIGQ